MKNKKNVILDERVWEKVTEIKYKKKIKTLSDTIEYLIKTRR